MESGPRANGGITTKEYRAQFTAFPSQFCDLCSRSCEQEKSIVRLQVRESTIP